MSVWVHKEILEQRSGLEKANLYLSLFLSLTHMWGSCFLSSAESECVTQHVNLLQTLSMTCEEASFTFSKSPAGGRWC